MAEGVVCNGRGNDYGWGTVVHGVDLELRREGARAVIGENVGKSTAMNMQAGIVLPTLGQCYPSPKDDYDAAKLLNPHPCNGKAKQ
jgi:ABC-type multidrug transport system ATPase subunit